MTTEELLHVLTAQEEPLAERFGPYVVWLVLVFLLGVIGWSIIRWLRGRRRTPSADQYAEQLRARWEADPTAFTPRSEHWPLAVAAIFGIENRTPWDRLEFTEPEPARAGLAEAWGIRSRPQMLAQIHALLREGHRVHFAHEVHDWSRLNADDARRTDADLAARNGEEAAEMRWRLAQVRQNSREIRGIRFEAWDLVRVTMLARAGFSLGWLSRAEALDTLRLVAPTLRENYTDWSDLGRHFFTARWYWASRQGPAAVDDDNYDAGRLQALTDPATGPWSLVPWDLPVPESRLLLVDALIAEGIVTEPGRYASTPLARRIDEAIEARLGGEPAPAA